MQGRSESPDPFRLEGKVVLITGGSRGIGLAVAEESARAGAEAIALVARDAAALAVACQRIEKYDIQCIGVTADVTRPADVEAMVAQVSQELGRIDILVNNAGGATFKSPLQEMRPEGWQKMIELNLFSSFLVSRAVLGRWQGSRGRRAIVNIGSTSSLKAFPELSYYSAAKHGLVGLTKTMAREVADAGVRVNLVCPHLVETQLTEGYRSGPDYEQLVADIPLKRWGDADEVARIVRFAASDAASYMTGAVLMVDGGWSS